VPGCNQLLRQVEAESRSRFSLHNI